MFVFVALDLLGDVPGDRLAFAIGVGREVDGLDLARGLADLAEDLLLALDDLVLGLEVPSSMSTPIFDFGRSLTWPTDAFTM